MRRRRTNEPIRETLRPLMEARGLTFRSLAAETKKVDHRDGRGITYGYLSNLVAGRDFASLRTLELLAAVFADLIEGPEYFPEYRLARLRADINERALGFDQAYANLQRFLEEVNAARDDPELPACV